MSDKRPPKGDNPYRKPPDGHPTETEKWPDGGPKEPPISELADFTLPPDPELTGRVKRSLNRHILMGDSLEFSLEIFQKTIWEYTKSAFEALPLPRRGNRSE